MGAYHLYQPPSLEKLPLALCFDEAEGSPLRLADRVSNGLCQATCLPASEENLTADSSGVLAGVPVRWLEADSNT